MDDSAKAPFNKLAAEDKKRYDEEMAAYKGKNPADAGKPKRPQSAYFCFLGQYRIDNKGKFDHKEIIKNGK